MRVPEAHEPPSCCKARRNMTDERQNTRIPSSAASAAAVDRDTPPAHSSRSTNVTRERLAWCWDRIPCKGTDQLGWRARPPPRLIARSSITANRMQCVQKHGSVDPFASMLDIRQEANEVCGANQNGAGGVTTYRMIWADHPDAQRVRSLAVKDRVAYTVCHMALCSHNG